MTPRNDPGYDWSSLPKGGTSHSLTSPQVPTLAEAMRMVKQCGVKEKTALIHTATLLIVKHEMREIHSLLETSEGRLDWLEREHAMKNQPWPIVFVFFHYVGQLFSFEPLCHFVMYLNNYLSWNIMLDNYSLLNRYVDVLCIWIIIYHETLSWAINLFWTIVLMCYVCESFSPKIIHVFNL
jgi:hypothetical protein